MQRQSRVLGQPGLHGRVFGESPEGVSPSGARRTVLDSLPSYGSRRSAVGGCDEVPVGEQPGLVLLNPVQPRSCLGSFAAESFELLHGPSQQMLIDVPGNGDSSER